MSIIILQTEDKNNPKLAAQQELQEYEKVVSEDSGEIQNKEETQKDLTNVLRYSQQS